MMQLMRWFFIILLSLLLAACQRSPQETTLVVLTPGGAIGKEARAVIRQFEAENPGVRVQLITSPGKDYYIKSLTMLAGRANVDLLWLGQGFGLFAGRGALYDLGPFIEADPSFHLGGYHPRVLGWYRYGKHLYGVPYGVDLQGIAFNKGLFTAAGLPFPKADWALDDMVEVAGRLSRVNSQTGRPEVIGLGLEDLDYRLYGLRVLTPDGRRFGLNNETGHYWLRRNVELVYDDRVLQRRGDMDSADRLTGFLNQQVAMFDIATWDMPDATGRALFEWDIVPIPRGTDGKVTAWASSAGFCMVARTSHPELSWKLLKKLAGQEFQQRMLKHTIPTLVALHDDYRSAHAGYNVNAFLEVLDGADPFPRIIPLEEVLAELRHWQDRAMLQELTPEEALKQAERNINRILSLHPLLPTEGTVNQP